SQWIEKCDGVDARQRCVTMRVAAGQHVVVMQRRAGRPAQCPAKGKLARPKSPETVHETMHEPFELPGLRRRIGRYHQRRSVRCWTDSRLARLSGQSSR